MLRYLTDPYHEYGDICLRQARTGHALQAGDSAVPGFRGHWNVSEYRKSLFEVNHREYNDASGVFGYLAHSVSLLVLSAGAGITSRRKNITHTLLNTSARSAWFVCDEQRHAGPLDFILTEVDVTREASSPVV